MNYIRKFNIPLPLDPAEVVVQFNSKVYLIWVQDEAFCAPTCTTSNTAIVKGRFLLGLAPEKIKSNLEQEKIYHLASSLS